MNNKLIAALVCFGMTGAAGAAEVDFDKGVDLAKTIEQAADLKAPFPGQPGFGDHHPGQWDNNNFHNYPGPSQGHVRYTRDCNTFNFGPSAGPMQSEMARLESVEYVQECHYVPDPPPPPNPNQPNHPGGPGGQPGGHPGGPGGPGGQPGGHPGGPGGPGGHGPKAADGLQTKGMQCFERPADVFRRTAQLNMAPRQLLPWENDSFEVCIEGPRVDIRTRSAAYSYNIAETGQYDIQYQLTPQYKVATAPDHNGMTLAGWAFKDGKFVLSVNDVWAQYYAGEKVAIKVELIKDGFLFFNTSLGEKEFVLDPANNYQLSFVEGDLAKTKDFVDTRGDRGPKKFFAKWSFRRVGSVSTQETVDKGSTEKITQ